MWEGRQSSIAARGRCVAFLLGLLILAPASAAWAVAPLGACCFNGIADDVDGGTCEDLTAFQCADARGDFIGNSTSCATVNCQAPVAAPLLSAAGAIAAAAAVAGVGFRRLRRRR